MFVNNGDLTFTEKGTEYGFNDLSRTSQACFFDKDNDGDLDVYMVNHPTKHTEMRQSQDGSIKPVDVGATYAESDKLYENVNGTYVDVTKKNSLQNVAFGLGVVSADLNKDGWQDLYIANDYSKPDVILLNNRDGTFKNIADTALKHMSRFSMGLDIADINNDGLLDIFNSEMLGKDNYSKKVNMASMNPELYAEFISIGLHYQDMHNSLQLNNENGTFSEISWLANVAETDWSWSPLLADYDNDGHKDLFVTNGYKRDVMNKDYIKNLEALEANSSLFEDKIANIPTSKTTNYILKNNGDLKFTDQSAIWGIKTRAMNSNGAAYADLDNDGDLDLIINNLEEKAAIYKNNSASNNFITLDLNSKNQNSYGAKVTVLTNGSKQYWEVSNTNGFQSHSDNRVHFGLSTKSKVDSIIIEWPLQGSKLYKNLEINKIHKLTYSEGLAYTQGTQNKMTLFTDDSQQVNISEKHKEKEYDDYIAEVLLPHKQSQEGPFIDVADVNGDGLDDFYQGNGVGFAGNLYLQQSTGSFKKSKQPAFTLDKSSEDIGVLFFDYDQDGDKDLYVVSGSNEHALESKHQLDRLYANDGKGNFTKTNNIIPEIASSGSCVKAADVDNDGDLDLFIGGFQIPGKYPAAGISSLLINEGGSFIDMTNKLAPSLKNIGMVKDAVFTDINMDGKQDLVVVGHWMPVSIFINEEGRFNNKTAKYGQEDKVGWWNTITAADIDGNGTQDLIVGNLGLNSKHKASLDQPFKIISKDFDGNGTNDIALGYYNNNTLYPVRGLQCSAEQNPDLKQRIGSYTEFANLTFDQVYSKYDLKDAISLSATYFESALFLNDGAQLTIQALPKENQLAPTNAIIVKDLNKDGRLEVITVGNLFPVEVETGRYDAHVGTVSHFNKKFSTVSMDQSGFFTDKDAKDLAYLVINGKPHIMVANNRDVLQFFNIH